LGTYNVTEIIDTILKKGPEGYQGPLLAKSYTYTQQTNTRGKKL